MPAKQLLKDALIVASFLVFVLVSYAGNRDLTPDGIGLDSDLQAYVEILDYEENRDVFRNDPVVHTYASFPAMSNTMIVMSKYFDGETYERILKAGGLSVFLYLTGFYILGRYLYRKPSLAAMLAILMSVTFYWAYGTFWGATHSDPVPRTLAAAVFPILTVLAIESKKRRYLQSVVMLLSGLSVPLHPITGVTYGAMFFMAFLLPGRKEKLLSNLRNLVVPTLLFLATALFFIHNMHVHAGTRTPEEMAVLQAIWDYRFAHNYADMAGEILARLRDYTIRIPIFPLALAGGIFLFRKREELPDNIRTLGKYIPGFLLGIVLIVAFVCTEMTLSRMLGRTQMSNELMRGTKFLLPVAILLITTFVYHIDTHVHISVPISIVLMVVVLAFSGDKQILAARHYVARESGISSIESKVAIRQMKSRAEQRQALVALKELCPEGTLVFTDTDDMAVRYFCHLPLAPIKKDGDKIYYHGDVQLGSNWLEGMKKIDEGKQNIKNVWKESGARILLSNSPDCRGMGNDSARRLYATENWSICERGR